MYKQTNQRKAEIYRKEYEEWKGMALDNFGYFPIFKPFKETFLLRNLSGNALKLYLYLGLMSKNTTGETWVSIDTTAEYFNKSKRTISGWIKELEKAKLIERMQMDLNGVAHTFLKPYGWTHLDNENSLQIKKKI
jgi:sarcosine oxidase delta subunit